MALIDFVPAVLTSKSKRHFAMYCCRGGKRMALEGIVWREVAAVGKERSVLPAGEVVEAARTAAVGR